MSGATFGLGDEFSTRHGCVVWLCLLGQLKCAMSHLLCLIQSLTDGLLQLIVPSMPSCHSSTTIRRTFEVFRHVFPVCRLELPGASNGEFHGTNTSTPLIWVPWWVSWAQLAPQ